MTTHISARTVRLATTVLAAAAALVAPAAALGEPGAVKAPAIAGVAPLPGAVVPNYPAAANLKVLKTTPDSGRYGVGMTISGTGLAANKDVTLTWSTANVDWMLDPRPDTVDYLGRKTTKLAVQIATAKTDASGAFSVPLKAPLDWGGIHDIYAVVDGQQVAKGGFLIKRWATISPKSGPIGTPITIKYYGLGSSLYEGSAAVMWDNHFVGQVTGNWTRGVATAHIRAAGDVGSHVVYLDNAVTYGYLNVPQSPLPWTTGAKMFFKITKDNGPPKASLDFPAPVAATLDAKTTLGLAGPATSKTAAARLASQAGTVGTKVGIAATGLVPNAPAELQWATVVGNRVNCSGTCWALSTVPLGSAKADGGGALSSDITVPDGLGGWHVVQIVQNGQIQAQTTYYVKRSYVGQSSITVKRGHHFTIHLKGVGWTQLDNTVAIDYDNSYVGYGCGFNSAGDVVLDLVATGKPGTHLIDGYPLLYTQQPSYANTPYGMIPFLSYADDEPGLALGYQLPAFRFAITVV